jgi:uncharacterized protein
MEIEYHEAKRVLILEDRGLDLARAGEVFEKFHLTRRDDKHSTEEEERFQTVGVLDADVVIVTWTLRGAVRRIVTMWKTNDRERSRYYEKRDRSG